MLGIAATVVVSVLLVLALQRDKKDKAKEGTILP